MELRIRHRMRQARPDEISRSCSQNAYGSSGRVEEILTTIPTESNNSTKSAHKKATFFCFVFVMNAYTTGGPFGLEDQVTTSGPGLTLLFHLFIPLFWCIPVSLVGAELTTAIPAEGGFYRWRWARVGFGDFWGFLAGWWNWSASFLLGSAYAVLFTDSLSFFFPAITGWKHYMVSIAVVALAHQLTIEIDEPFAFWSPEIDSLGFRHGQGIDFGLRGPLIQCVSWRGPPSLPRSWPAWLHLSSR
jgi:Amino acid permease